MPPEGLTKGLYARSDLAPNGSILGGTFTTFICCYESAILSGVLLSFLLVGLDCLFSKQLL